jgi:signal transduction histidine kinase
MAAPRSPAVHLGFGLVLTLSAVAAYTYYTTRQLAGLRVLQTDLVDRNRQDSLQLLRIQNNLNLLGLALRDMADPDQPYPLTAWQAQLQRIRGDLEDALHRENALAVAGRTPGDRERLNGSMAQFWDAVDRTLTAAGAGRVAEARDDVTRSLPARQASLSTTVARLLVENNARDENAAAQVQQIYDRVQRQVYGFLIATLFVIAATGLYFMRSSRRLFAEVAQLSDRRRELAQQLIATRESTLRHVARELHDEFGQILTAIGSMLGRVERQMPEDSPVRADLREVSGIAQETLTRTRSLSQTLHPSILEELGLSRTVEWYLGTLDRQLGLDVSYERTGTAETVDANTAIHVYRVLQEAMNNVARHSGTTRAWVRMRDVPGALELEVEDHGVGLGPRSTQRGLGLVAIRERAELVGGTVEFLRPDAGGTLVRLRVPVGGGETAPA